MFKSTFQTPFQNPFPTEGAAEDNWWLSGGISSGDCVAAYQPKGAVDLANSYINLANSGTYDAAPGVAPTWNLTDGWIFNGSSQYLISGYTWQSSNTVIVKFTFPTTSNREIVLNNSLTLRLVANAFYGVGYKNGNEVKILPKMPTGGVLGISGTKGFRNGVEDTAGLTNSPTSQVVYIAGTPVRFWSGRIQAMSIYSTVLSNEQVLAVTNAMNLL